jgi:hypothetical protein
MSTVAGTKVAYATKPAKMTVIQPMWTMTGSPSTFLAALHTEDNGPTMHGVLFPYPKSGPEM